jgi:uncharacterized protein (DUF58 family)
LDWRVYARSDRYYLKKYEDETNLRAYLLVDRSRSMDYGSSGYSKGDYANTLAATLAYFLHAQGDAVGLVSFDEQLRDYLPARHRTGHLRHLMLHLEHPARGRTTSLGAPLKRVAELVRRRSLVVMISDFLAPLDSFEEHLATLAACGHETILFQVLDPAETKFQFDEPLRFEDLESGQTVLVDPVAARTRYLERFNAHQAAVRKAGERWGMTFRQFTTDQPVEWVLFDFLRERMRRGRAVQRHRATRTS